jgi:poly(3-hydroxybutyrate) depolymerase
MTNTTLATCAPRRSPALAASEILSRNTFAWLDICQSSAAVGLSYWTGAAARGATPYKLAVDGLRWLQIVGSRRAPTWSTPNRVVSSSKIMALRDFSGGSAAATIPSLLLPPQAGHHSCIVDYSPTQSQVLTARAAGLTSLYVLEWLGATPGTDTSIGEYIESVREAIARIGRPVNLIGDCQGGWLATLYTALHPEDVATLTIGGAPIDFHAGSAAIADAVQVISAARGMEPYRLAVELGGGVLRGELLLGGFIALQPQTEVSKHLELLLHLDDDDFVKRYAEFQDWYTFTQDLPGAMYLWAVEHLFLGNELVRGTLEIDGRPVRLESITCPVNLLAGSEDHITPPEQVFALADHVGTAPDKITKWLTNGGHLGLFMGRNALRNAWLPLLQSVAAHAGGPSNS